MMAEPLAADTNALKAKLLVPEPGIETADVQVITPEAALQLQFAACGPLRATLPSGTLSWTGRTSTTVMLPKVAAAP